MKTLGHTSRGMMFALVVTAMLTVALTFAIAVRVFPVSPAMKPAASEVKIDNFTFQPATITVTSGTKVIWTNHDDEPHTVVSGDAKFKSHALDTNDRFSFTFSNPGSYAYFCSLHPRMVGKVIVK